MIFAVKQVNNNRRTILIISFSKLIAIRNYKYKIVGKNNKIANTKSWTGLGSYRSELTPPGWGVRLAVQPYQTFVRKKNIVLMKLTLDCFWIVLLTAKVNYSVNLIQIDRDQRLVFKRLRQVKYYQIYTM